MQLFFRSFFTRCFMSDYITGSELQCMREACGLDRDQLAERVGVQGRSIKHWEMRSNGVPADVAALVLDLEAQISKEAALRLSHYNGRTDMVILLRTADPVKNEVASRVYLELRRAGQDVRIVNFDYKAFRVWLGAGQDTPAMRQAWAVLAIKEQARPHGQDQPHPL
jgi:hypothetical protein